MSTADALAKPALLRAQADVWEGKAGRRIEDAVAEEVPVALVFNGVSHVVMMASPADLEDFALGFSLTEHIIQQPDEIYDLDLVPQDEGISVEITISAQRFLELKQQRRNMTGRTGCGLCGTESLEQAVKPIRRVSRREPISDAAIQRAVLTLRDHQADYQPLQGETGATHAAAWCDMEGRIASVREDVGRHNALDKLIGCQLRAGRNFEHGFVLISSRASFEMVHKSAAVGIGCLVAVSAPTSLAITQARKAAMMLVGFARPNRHVIYNVPENPV